MNPSAQESTVASEVPHIIALFHIDTARSEILKTLGPPPKRLSDQERKDLLKKLGTLETQAKELDVAIRQMEAALELNSERMARAVSKRAETRIPQELQTIAKETDQLKRARLQLDQTLAQKKSAERENQRLRTEIATKTQPPENAPKLAPELAEKITQLDKERAACIANLSVSTKSRYERIAQARQGRALALFANGMCMECHRTQPAQMQSNLKSRREWIVCQGCQRILVLNDN